jgi:hypothetical protein
MNYRRLHVDCCPIEKPPMIPLCVIVVKRPHCRHTKDVARANSVLSRNDVFRNKDAPVPYISPSAINVDPEPLFANTHEYPLTFAPICVP